MRSSRSGRPCSRAAPLRHVRESQLARPLVERGHLVAEDLPQPSELPVQFRGKLLEYRERLVGRPGFGARHGGCNRPDPGVELNRVRQHVIARLQTHFDERRLNSLESLLDCRGAGRERRSAVKRRRPDGDRLELLACVKDAVHRRMRGTDRVANPDQQIELLPQVFVCGCDARVTGDLELRAATLAAGAEPHLIRAGRRHGASRRPSEYRRSHTNRFRPAAARNGPRSLAVKLRINSPRASRNSSTTAPGACSGSRK